MTDSRFAHIRYLVAGGFLPKEEEPDTKLLEAVRHFLPQAVKAEEYDVGTQLRIVVDRKADLNAVLDGTVALRDNVGAKTFSLVVDVSDVIVRLTHVRRRPAAASSLPDIIFDE
ncbi:hypothetical protein ACFL26_01855 [Patescibacteria group bacterium]